MSYLDKLNRFASNPVNLDLKRSTFKRPFEFKCTMKEGKLYPIMVDEILPGDTYHVNVNSLFRSITPAVPVMDNAYADIFAFWVPNRIATKNPNDWQKICGENFNTAWAPASESTLISTGNTITYDQLSPKCNSVAAYMGVAPYVDDDYETAALQSCYINVMPFIAYGKIWNEWFRDQNVQAPIVDWTSFIRTIGNEDSFLDVNRFHDYFTSALPAPQKGSSVLLPFADVAPVITKSQEHITSGGSGEPVKFRSTNYSTGPLGTLYVNSSRQLGSNGTVPSVSTSYLVQPTNLYADLTQATATSVNELRQAFAIQKLLEKDARGGSRFREMLRAQYGVSIPDNTVQVPEYLGGKRISLNMQQVIQNSETATTPLGTTGAFSNTFDSSSIIHKSFSEHGYIIVLACIRTQNTYSQGINRMFLRNRRFDWYYPVFSNLGEQSVRKIELYIPKFESADQTVAYFSGNVIFGYQEAWAEYRYKPSMVAGFLHPDSGDDILSSWTYTNRFNATPTLNSDFMKEGSSKIGNTLVYPESSYQFICDFYFDMTCRRVMPLYSIPGLIDHH